MTIKERKKPKNKTMIRMTVNDDVKMAASDDIGIKMAASDDIGIKMAASDDIGRKMAASDDIRIKMAVNENEMMPNKVNSITEEMTINELEMMLNQLLMLIMSLNKYVKINSSFYLHENYHKTGSRAWLNFNSQSETDKQDIRMALAMGPKSYRR